MIKCNVCGAANSLDSSVCVECGAALGASRKNTSTYSEKEIFSNTRTEEFTRSGEQKIDLFSSGEKYERMRKGAVLEKIYKQEQAMGEVTELEEPPEPEEVKPIIISRQSSSDIVGKKKKSSKKNSGKNKSVSKNYKIPQRVIEPSELRLAGQKNKTQPTGTPDKKSDSANDTRKNDNGSRKNQNSRNKSNPEQQKKNFNPDRANNKNNGSTPKKVKSDKVKTESEKVPVKPEQAVAEQNKMKKKPSEKAIETVEKASAGKAKTGKPVNEGKAKSSVKTGTDGERTIKAKTKENSSKTDSSKAVKKNPDKVSDKSGKDNKTQLSAAAVKNAKHDSKSAPTKKAKKISSVNVGTPSRPRFNDSDINSNKNLAALAYIGILFLIPLAKSKNSYFCKMHTRQGIAVFIYSLIISLLTLTAVIGLRVLLLWKLGLSYTIYNILSAAIGILMLILLLVPVFSGALSAFSGVYKSVPIVGKFVNKKNRK